MIDIEKTIYNLNSLKISYNEFSSKTKKYYSIYYPNMFRPQLNIYANESLVKSINGNQLTEEQYNKLSLDNLKKIGDPLLKSLNLSTFRYSYSVIQLSKVYSITSNSKDSLSFKYIYVKKTGYTNKNDLSLYRKYTFAKVNRHYVLFSIEDMHELDTPISFGDKIKLY